jgi:hypothetical protein
MGRETETQRPGRRASQEALTSGGDRRRRMFILRGKRIIGQSRFTPRTRA